MACMTACQNTPKTPALDMANFDLSVAPNADFYEYATGGWQKNNPLKPEYARYGSSTSCATTTRSASTSCSPA